MSLSEREQEVLGRLLKMIGSDKYGDRREEFINRVDTLLIVAEKNKKNVTVGAYLGATFLIGLQYFVTIEEANQSGLLYRNRHWNSAMGILQRETAEVENMIEQSNIKKSTVVHISDFLGFRAKKRTIENGTKRT